MTDDEGYYRFDRVPAGSYSLKASKAGLVTLHFGQARAFEPLQTFRMDETPRLDAHFVLPSAGAIAGRIVDEHQQPLSDVAIGVLRETFVATERSLVPIAVSGNAIRTDDLGLFRVHSIPEGNYVVTATAGGAFMASARKSLTKYAYPQTYYPGTAEYKDALRVMVRPGQVSDTSMTLRPKPLLNVAGVVVDSVGRPVPEGIVRLVERQSGPRSPKIAPIRPNGTFRVDLVNEGDYTLDAVAGGQKTGGQPELGRMTFKLGKAGNEAIRVSTKPAREISGRVVVEDGTLDELKGRPLRIQTRSVDPGDVWLPSVSGPVSPDGQFVLKNVLSRSLLVVDLSPNDGWSVANVRYENTAVDDEGVEPGAHGVILTLSRSPSRLSGIVSWPAGSRTAGGIVVVFSVSEARWRDPIDRYVSVVRAETDGSFTMLGMPGGSYWVTAVATIDVATLSDPGRLRRLVAFGTKVELATGKRVEVRLQGNDLR